MLSARVERLFKAAQATWDHQPPNYMRQHLQYAALHLYQDKPAWERTALSVAYMLTNAPVLLTEDDELIGRGYLCNRVPEEECDSALRNYLIQGIAHNNYREDIGRSVCADYPRQQELNLIIQPSRGHITWDWAWMLREGTTGMKAAYRAALAQAKDEEAEHFYQGVLIALDAVENWSDRHADKLDEMGRHDLAARCRKVPRFPAENFREAVQAFLMQYILVMMENPFGGNGIGQFDKYMWPYLKKDLENGMITMEEAREVIDELFIRIDERVARVDNHGEMILAGGTHRDGSSAVSPLSQLLVESIMELNITHPSVYMRVPEDADDDYYRLCARYVLKGGNRAQIFYDPAVRNAMVKTNRHAPEDTAEYAIGGCMEVGVQGMSSDFLQCGWLNLPLMLELAITGGYSLIHGEQIDSCGVELPGLAAFDDFEDFYRNFITYVDRLVGLSNEVLEKWSIHDEQYRPAYLMSSMIHDCLERGRHMHAGGARYHDYSTTPVGIPNTADALYAVKAAVFEQKICTAEELIAAMKANYQGYEDLQRKLQALPKYGREHPDADAFVHRFVTDVATAFVTKKNRFGGIFRPIILTFTYGPYAAKHVGATADGNYAHAMIAQGLTPQSKSMDKGITAAMNSCACLPFELFSGGATTMWDLDPAWATEEIVVSLLKTYFAIGGQIYQGNVTDVRELLAAQKDPESYRNLIVRVGGYSARFTGLEKALQDDIINRRQHRG